MSINTVKTLLGSIKSLFAKYTPWQPRARSLSDIYNYLQINDRISSSGQPTEKQFQLIKQHGFQCVINLAPDHGENSLKDEAGTLSALNMRYLHIPVDFGNPTQADFDRFALELGRLGEDKVWIHCAANMRVSAFIYKYRCKVLGERPDVAESALLRIWTPYGVWKQFIA